MHKFKINWINVIKEHMTKTRKRTEYHIPYVVLVSKFIEHFEVDVDCEVVEAVKAQHEVTATILHKIGLKKVDDDYWICRANKEEAGQQQNQEDNGAEPVLLLLLE